MTAGVSRAWHGGLLLATLAARMLRPSPRAVYRAGLWTLAVVAYVRLVRR